MDPLARAPLHLALCLLLAAPALAQGPAEGVQAPPPEGGIDAGAHPYEGRPVRAVRVMLGPKDGGQRREADEATGALVFNNIRTKAGEPFQTAGVSQDLSRLNRLGRFNRAEVLAEPVGDGWIDVVFLLWPHPTVRDVQVVGNKAIDDQTILKELDVIIGTPVDALQLERRARRIEDLYRSRNYAQASVRVDQEQLERAGIVIFRVREGPRTKVVDIRFEGNASFTPDELRTALKTKTAWLLNSAPLDSEVLEQDAAALVAFYRDRGYLDARADRAVRLSPDSREAIVTFLIDEGPLYTLRDVQLHYLDAVTPGLDEPAAGPVDPEKVPPPGRLDVAQVRGLMVMKPGDVFSAKALDDSIAAVQTALSKMGYADVQVNARQLREGGQPAVDLLVIIRQGRPWKVGEVIITGNGITKDKVIRRQVTLLPDRPLDSAAIKETQRRIEATNLFDRTDPIRGGVKVTVQDPDPSEPDHRDVLVEVTETNTALFSAGVGVTSDSGAAATISLSQRNFDIADTPESLDELLSGRAFRGAGQTFAIDIAPGTRSQNYNLSLSEPSLFETLYSGSAGISYRTRDYREYDEQRVGARFALGRRLGSTWSLSVPVRIEGVELSDIEPDNPVDYFEVEEQKIITGAGLSLTRSTLDSVFNPSKGARTLLGLEQTGVLGGDFSFTSLRAEQSLFLTLDETFLGAKTVLGLNAKASYIPQGQDAAPVYERFYLGGQNFRGFALRTIAPRGVRQDNGELGNDPVGGSFSFFLGAELKQPVYEDILSLAFFVDSGTVNSTATLDNYRVSAGVGLRVTIPQLTPAPLAFDFGIPLMKEDGDRERLFTFSIDLAY